MDKQFCTNCGKEINMTSKFCPGCGVPVNASANNEPEAVAETPVAEIPAVQETPVAEIPAVQETPVVEAVEEVPVATEAPVAVEEVPVAEEAPVAPVTGFFAREIAARNAKGKVFRAILSILLCVLIFASSILAVVGFDVRKATEADAVEDFVMSIDPDDEDASDVFGVDVFMFKEEECDVSDMSLLEFLCEWVSFYYNGNFEMSESALSEWIEETEIREFIAEKAASYIEDIYDGEADASLKEKEIKKLLEKGEYVVRSEGTFPDEYSYYFDKDERIEWINENAIDFVMSLNIDETVGVDALKENQPVIYNIVHIGLSYYVIIGLVVLDLLLALLLFVVNKKSIAKSFKALGITMIAVSGIVLIATLVLLVAPKLLGGVCGSSLISGFISSIFTAGSVASLAILGVGVLLVVISVIISKIVSKKEKKILAETASA